MVKLTFNSQSSSGNASDGGGKKSKTTHRRLENWLKAYAEYTIDQESPESFHLWTGLSVLASAVRRNVWLNQGVYILYPNMYVILVGPPGRVAKSTTIRMGRRILYKVEGINFGPDSLSREELIRQMAQAGGQNQDSALTIHSSELSSLIEVSGIKMIQFLTDIYDCEWNPKGWRYSTKGSGKDTIHNPVLNILAGTTPSWIAEGMPAAATEHGFTSRVIFVYEDSPRYLRPFPDEPDKKLVDDLANDLDHISRIEGEFEWGEGAKDYYEDIYKKIAETIPKDYRLESFHNRKKIHVLKVAMLLSLAQRDDLTITPDDIGRAMDILDMIEGSMHKTFSALGKYEHAGDLERIEARIRSEGGMSSEQIYDEFYAVGDPKQLGGILVMLLSMGRIERKKEDGESYYYPL